MLKRDWILPSFCTLALCGLIAMNSCAHSRGAEEVDEADNTEQGATTDTAQSDAGANGDSEPVKAPPKDEALAELESTVNEAPKTDEGTAGVETTLEQTGGSSLNTADSAISADNSTTPSSDLNEIPNNDPSVPTETASTQAPSDNDNSDLVITEGTPVIAEPKSASTNEDNEPVQTAKIAIRRTPHIPGRAITRKGVLLNRFYFVRKGDTAKSVSSLFYGTPDHSTELTAWNGGTWKPGKLIYYQSTSEAKDTKMRSFYQERSVPAEDYIVSGSDTLARIATKKLGSAGSWKEIAVVNGLDSPGSLERGQKLSIYPGKLSQYGSTAQPEEKHTPPPQVNTPPAVAQFNEAPPAEVPSSPEPKPVKNSGGGFDIAKLVEQNLFAVAIGGIILVLLIALMAVNRKKKAGRREEFAEEGFNSPPKARRK